jgi:hypothetical protein
MSEEELGKISDEFQAIRLECKKGKCIDGLERPNSGQKDL